MITIKDSTKHKRDIKKALDAHIKGLNPLLKKRITDNITANHQEVRDFLEVNLEDILSAKPSKMLELQQEFDDLDSVKVMNAKKKEALKKEKKKEGLEKEIEKVFNWKWFSGKNVKGRYSACTLTNALNVKVCPYCNTNYTLTISKGKKNIIRPALDHFFPKSELPIFALSFYNLIPACFVCNSSLKGPKPSDLDNHFHPYIHEVIDDITFNFIPNSVQGVTGLHEDFDITIDVDSTATHKTQAEGHIKAFKLKDIYDQHKDFVSEIIYKSQMADGSYLQSLQGAFPNLQLNRDDFYRIAYGNYLSDDDIGSRPMAKICKDIVNQLDGYLKT